MNKDALLATIIGFCIGLVITGVILVGPSIAHALPNLKLPAFAWPKFEKPTTITPTPTPPGITTLTISSPLPDSIEADSSIIVSGSAPADSAIVVSGLIDEDATTTHDDGKYAGKISLVEGKNDIIVAQYKDGKETTQTVVVYYTPEEF